MRALQRRALNSLRIQLNRWNVPSFVHLRSYPNFAATKGEKTLFRISLIPLYFTCRSEAAARKAIDRSKAISRAQYFCMYGCQQSLTDSVHVRGPGLLFQMPLVSYELKKTWNSARNEPLLRDQENTSSNCKDDLNATGKNNVYSSISGDVFCDVGS